jgi:AcrR family transcriptional regulator
MHMSQRAPTSKSDHGGKAARAPASGQGASTPRKRAEKSAARREAILAAALEEFTARGYAAARLDDVAKRADVAKGTIYLHFRDKEALFQEIVGTMLVPLIDVLVSPPPPNVPIRIVLQGFADLFIREVYNTNRRDVLRLVMTEGPRFPHLAEFYYRNVVERAVAAMRGLLQQAAARGEIPHASVIAYPQLVVAPMITAIIWSGLFDRFEPLDVAAMMRAHIDILFGKGSVP